MHRPPTLKQVIVPVAFSIFRNKYKYKGEYHAAKEFEELVDAQHLQAFADYFGYKNPTPLAYLYILAQRAQLALMVEKAFPVPVVGLVHLENTLTQKSAIDITKPFQIKARVQALPATGSIPFQFTVAFFQGGAEVIRCESLYLSKRKSNQPKKAKEEISLPEYAFTESFEIASNKGNSYAALSGDYNPIHTSSLLAKLFGFKRKIIHGWYTVNYVTAALENMHSAQATSIVSSFKSPLFLPGKAVLRYAGLENKSIRFTVTNTNNSLLYVSGQLGF